MMFIQTGGINKWLQFGLKAGALKGWVFQEHKWSTVSRKMWAKIFEMFKINVPQKEKKKQLVSPAVHFIIWFKWSGGISAYKEQGCVPKLGAHQLWSLRQTIIHQRLIQPHGQRITLEKFCQAQQDKAAVQKSLLKLYSAKKKPLVIEAVTKQQHKGCLRLCTVCSMQYANVHLWWGRYLFFPTLIDCKLSPQVEVLSLYLPFVQCWELIPPTVNFRSPKQKKNMFSSAM